MAQDNRSFESTLHDIVYSIDTGTGLKIIRVTLYVLILMIIVMLYTATQFRGLATEEAMDYAQLGRNISFSNGLVTKCVRPVSMWKVASRNPGENPQIGGHPDLFHPPAYPLVLGGGFRLFQLAGLDPFAVGADATSFPAEQWVVMPVNHIFSLLTGWIVFSLGKRLFSREIGFLGITIFYLSDLVWSDSISGLNISMTTFMITAAFYTMVIAMLNHRDRRSVVAWVLPFVLSVAFSAGAILTRYIAVAALPGIALFAWLVGGRFRGGGRFVVVYLILCMMMVAPWLYRNYAISGNPLGLAGYSALIDTPNYPDHSLERQLHPSLSLGKAVGIMKDKWVANYAGPYASTLPGMGGGIMMGLFACTFFYRFVRPQVNDLRWGLGLSILTMLFIAGFFSGSSVDTLHAFWPFIILYGLAFFYILIDRLNLGVRLYVISLKCLIVLLSLIPLILTILPPHARTPYPPYHPPFIHRVSSWLNEREVMTTDMPWATAWYGDRISILLPRNIEEFYEINDLKQYVSGLYLTTLTKDKPLVSQLLDGPEQSWLPVMSGRTPPDFPLKQGIQLNRQDQLFLSDRNRWAEGVETGQSLQ